MGSGDLSMGNVIISLVLLLLIAVAFAHIIKIVKTGGSCCGSGSDMAPKIKVADRDKTHYPYKYRLKVEGMVCAGCVRNVENAINSDGELWAVADLGKKEVRVLAKRRMGLDDFLKLFEKTHYTLSDIEHIS